MSRFFAVGSLLRQYSEPLLCLIKCCMVDDWLMRSLGIVHRKLSSVRQQLLFNMIVAVSLLQERIAEVLFIG